MFELVLHTGNDAFNNPAEISRILREAAAIVESAWGDHNKQKLRDVNGNVCGEMRSTPPQLPTVTVQFQQHKYNYTTRINGTDEEIKRYFVGRRFNLGGIVYDHATDKEIEIDNWQTCQGVTIERPKFDF
jgi:hypothetical protein